MGWTMDQDGNWSNDNTAEIDRDDAARNDWERMKRQEEEWLRRHQTPDLQIVPVEQEEEKPRSPTPDEIQKIIDGLDRPKPKTPYLH